jgi:hypothetical protein
MEGKVLCIVNVRKEFVSLVGVNVEGWKLCATLGVICLCHIVTVNTAGFWNGKVKNVVIYACCILCFFCFWLLLFITSNLRLFSYNMTPRVAHNFQPSTFTPTRLTIYFLTLTMHKTLPSACYNMNDLILYML